MCQPIPTGVSFPGRSAGVSPAQYRCHSSFSHGRPGRSCEGNTGAAGLYRSPTRGGPHAARALGPYGAAAVCCHREPPRLGCTGTPANRGRTEPRGRLQGDAFSSGRAGAVTHSPHFSSGGHPPSRALSPNGRQRRAHARGNDRPRALLRLPRPLSHNASRTGRISRERGLSRPRGTRHLGEAGIT